MWQAVLRCLLLFSLLLAASNSLADTSPNLINNDNWDGATYGNDPGGCCASASGDGALYDNNTDTIMFSYGRDVLAQTIAINEALKLSGIEVDGFNYGWTWRKLSNNGSGNDTLQFEVTVKDAAGNEVERYVYDYGSSLHAMDVWHTESGTETFAQSYLDPQSIALSIIGKDGGFWAGYYGPEVKDVSLTLNYSANPCAANPLYDPSCEGYADAYAEQQYNQNCSADPLYDSGCPGYAQAYETQQCNADPLYSPSCSGYAAAYLDQQCTLDQTYDPACPLYNDFIGTDGSVNQWDPTDQASTGNLWTEDGWNQLTYQPPTYDGSYSDNGTFWQFYHYMYNGSAAWLQMASINAALKAQGISVDGIKYGWEIDNNMYTNSSSNLTVTLNVTDADGNTIMTDQYNYTWADGDIDLDAVKYFGVDTIQEQVDGANLKFHFQDRDRGAYKGYYIVDPSTIYTEFVYHVDECIVNPLFSTTCEGHAQAYYDQQCSINPLYDAGCPGYAQAYYDQQCTVSALYDSGCPGYAQAYYDNQCSLNPLYDTGCNGYADAYFSQQCGLDALYDSQCPGYATAYYNQQCGLDALYDSGCTGYEEKYFATYIQPELERQAQAAAGTSTEDATTPTVTTNATTAEDPVAALTATPATGDATVDQVLRETANVSTTIELPGMVETTPPAGSNLQTDTPSGSEPEAATATEPSAEAELEAELASLDEGGGNEEEVSESSDNVDESSEEGSDDSGNSESGDGDSGESSKDEKSEKSGDKKSPEQQKRDKLKEIATQRAMMLAETMGQAASLEQQQAVQAQIAALINFVPGFNAYGQVGIPGGDMYAEQPFYEDKKVPENQRGLRNGLAQQLLHEKMVEQQYELGAK